MNVRPLVPLLLFLPLALEPEPAGELRLEPDEQNVTAERLFGRWERDPVVGERMGLPPRDESIEFAPAEDFLHLIPAEFAERLAELRIFELGTVTFRKGDQVSSSGPYLLTTLPSGNPHLIFFRERDGEPLADGESANIFVAPGQEREHDLLLLGADFDNEPFRPFRRVEEGE